LSKKFTRRDTFKLAGTLASGAAAASLTPGSAQAEQTHEQAHVDADAGMYDPLTGLPTEPLFYDRMKTLMRIEGQHLTLAIIDIDGFDEFHQAHGDIFADSTTLTFARRICRFVRDDCENALHTVAFLQPGQYGLINLHDSTVGVHFQTEAVKRAIRTPLTLKGRNFAFTASIGMVRQEAHHPGSDLIAMAKHAAKEARQRGRDQIAYYAQEAPQPMPESLRDSLRKYAQDQGIITPKA